MVDRTSDEALLASSREEAAFECEGWDFSSLGDRYEADPPPPRLAPIASTWTATAPPPPRPTPIASTLDGNRTSTASPAVDDAQDANEVTSTDGAGLRMLGITGVKIWQVGARTA